MTHPDTAARRADLEEYQHHIRHPHEADHPNKAICGAIITSMDWVYADIGHAFLSAPLDRIHPCPACAAKIVEVFSTCE